MTICAARPDQLDFQASLDRLCTATMFEGWGEFYLMAGSAAAVLIGLIFVVITLMQDRSRSTVLSGSRLFMGPIVLHMSFVLALSSAALAQG